MALPFFGFSFDGGGLDAGAQRFVQESSNPPEQWSDWMWNQVRQSNYSIDMLPPGMTPAQARERDPQVIAQRQQEEQQRIAQQTAAAQATAQPAPAPGPAPEPTPPSPPPAEPGESDEQRLAREMAEREAQRGALRTGALGQLESLLPAGFEQTLAPTSLYGPSIESIYARERAKPEELIANMLKRGTLTETGRARGVTALEQQTPGIRQRLTNIGNLLLEQERAGLRGIAGRGREAASALELGQTFDPGAYRREAEQNVASFTQGLPGGFEAQLGGGPLFSDIGAAAGAVSGQAVPFDPYAVEGGQLKTGLEAPLDVPKARRRTSVF